MVNIPTVSMAIIPLLVVPALCMGGVVVHDCECAAEITCSCETNCEHKTECGHEDECPGESCTIRVVSPQRQHDHIGAARPDTSMALISSVVKQSRGESVYARMLELPGTRELPFPPSDLPLLI